MDVATAFAESWDLRIPRRPSEPYCPRISSTLACAGLPDSDEQVSALLDRIMPEVQLLGAAGGNRVARWQDPSGARLVLEVGADGVLDLLPSFSAGTTVLLGDLRAANRTWRWLRCWTGTGRR